MKKLILRFYSKSEVMIRPLIRFLNHFAYQVNTRWAWFFTNGMKTPRELPQLVEPENYK